jgi:hypothetical protein
MIYSKRLQTDIPVTIEKNSYNLKDYGKMTCYRIKDDKITVGQVDLQDIPRGVHVTFITNMNPQLYKGVGALADQIEVEHCMQRGLKDFRIVSEAALNSHALHYLRGKRFIDPKDPEERKSLLEKFQTFNINDIVKSIIEKTPKGERFKTSFLGQINMFMPKEMIKKYMEIAKEHPVLK